MGAASASALTNVSLTFTNALANQNQARQILADHGMKATFFVNSGRVSDNGRLTWRQVRDLAADGNEIGGQGLTNAFLTGLTPAELEEEVCGDRDALLGKGYSPVSFAYPRGSADADAAARAKVEECGYASGRGNTGLGGTDQPKAEALPIADPYLVRTRGTIDQNDTLAEIQTWITQAEDEAGANKWFPISFTNLCDPNIDVSCPSGHITPTDFDALLDWLQPRTASGTFVRTVRKVVTGTDQPVPPPLGGTIISLTFDDGEADQMNAKQIMADHDVNGTFYINSDRIDQVPRRLTWTQVAAIAADGNEIAGHTIGHVHLPQLTEAQQQAAICDDRQALTAHGYNPTSFAYPYGEHDPLSESLVEQCGYTNARGVGGVGPNAASLAESNPPEDPFVIRTRGSVEAIDTVEVVKGWIQDAESVGDGWLPLVFHHICDPETDMSGFCEPIPHMTPQDFDELLDWLEPRTAQGTVVQTVGEVMADPPTPPTFDEEPPVTQISCNAAPCVGPYGSTVSATLSANDTGGAGLKEIRYTTDGSVPTGSSSIYTGPIPVNSTTTLRFRASDNYGNVEPVKTQNIVVDTVPPTTTIACNGSPCIAGFYNASVSATLSANDTGGSGLKEIRYTTDGGNPTGSSPLYTGAIPVNSTTTIKFRAEDNVGNVESVKSQLIQIETIQPESSIQCNGGSCSTFFNSAVSATLSANDTGGSGVKNIRYTTDGSAPTGSSPIYSGPIPVNSTTTIKFRAEDNAGNIESPVESQLIKFDTTPATSAALCDGAPCLPGGYDNVVRVTLVASSPPGEAPPTEIRYTLDGSAPTDSSPLFTGDFFIEETTTVRFRSKDEAGNVEAPKSELVRVDIVAPTTQIECNLQPCQSAYNAPVSVTLNATDQPGGGGVKEIRYTTDGSAPTASSPLYTGAFMVNTSATVRYRAEDNAGNVETPKSRAILIENSAPTSSIACNGSPCIAGFYNASVSATLSANDTGGAGVKNIRYTTDGSNPTGSSPIYSGAIPVNSTTTIKFRAEDNAGNVESPVNSQTIQIDTQEPTSSISCDSNPCLASYDHAVSATLSANDAGAAGIKEIRYTTDGSEPTASSILYTGPIPVNSTTTIKFRAEDNAGNVESPVNSQTIVIDTVDPTSTIECDSDPCQATFYDDTVSATLEANDTGGSGVKNIRYTTDGSAPTGSSPVYSGPIPVNSTTTIKFRAEDNAGNVEAVNSQTISIDMVDPTSTIACDGNPCSAAYAAPVSATLSANDTGGSGLKEIRYTTDGSDPTASSTLYTGAIPVNSTTTIKFRAEDNAGNVESPTHTQEIVIDTLGPVSSLTCDFAPCEAGGYNNVVRAILSATAPGGATVTEIRYTLDGSEPTDSSTLYTGDFFISETTTVKFRAKDSVGHVEPTRTETVLIDPVAPSTEINCDGVTCEDFYNHAVSVSLPSDDGGGGGVKEIRYTTDGSAPTGSSTLYTGAFLVSSTTQVRFRAEDNAGNIEAPKSRTVSIETSAPTSTIACDGNPCIAGFYDDPVSATLSANDTGGSGVKNIRYTTDGSEPTGSSPIYSGAIPVNSTTTIKFRAEDNAGNVESPVNSQLIQIDTQEPTSTIECDGNPCIAGFYNASVSATLSANDAGAAGIKEIRYTTDGSAPTGSSPIYSGAIPVNSTTTIKFRAEDNAGNVESPVNSQLIQIDTQAPTSSISCNGSPCIAGFYNASVSATLSANDAGAAGIKEIRYTTDGSEPTASSTLYTGAIPVNSTTTIKFRAEDNAGNVESPVNSQLIQIETSAPTSAIECDGNPCIAGFYDGPISATLSADDTGGSGVKNIRYTTDGSTPTGSSPIYSGAIPVNSTTTIKFRAEDNAGNVESPVNSQLIQIDTQEPTSSIACNGNPCIAGFYNASVSATLSANDAGAAGIKEIRYTTDGSEPTGSSPIYSGAIPVNSTTTIKFRAEDNAGNVESPVNSQLIQIDTQAPTSSISCNGSPCIAGFYNASVSATLAANDTGGSGVKNIRYTTDGSEPTGSSPIYSGAIPVNSTTTIKFRAEDNAGSVETPVNSQLIQIENSAPTSAIECDGSPCEAGFYTEPISATLNANDTGGSGVKEIRYTTDGSNPTGSSPIYSGAIPVNSTTTIKFRAEDNAGNVESPVNSQLIQVDTQEPTSSIACNGNPCIAGFYNASVSATLSANDTGGSGVKEIRYTTDGSAPTGSSPVYSGAIPVNSTTTISWRAEDNAGNLESPVNSQEIQIDTQAPTSTIECDGDPCIAGFYTDPISATLAANDTGGSGVKNIRYTTDGSAPTGSSPVYSGAIPVNSTTTIRWRAEDNAGNVESPVNSQQIQIDTGAPSTAILCNGAACQPSYTAPVSATLNANDDGGSGVKEIRYTTDGSEPTASSTLYSGAIAVTSTMTIRFRAEDNLGNVETPTAQTIQIVPPTVQPTTTTQPPTTTPGETEAKKCKKGFKLKKGKCKKKKRKK